jgi:hypothetical protein
MLLQEGRLESIECRRSNFCYIVSKTTMESPAGFHLKMIIATGKKRKKALIMGRIVYSDYYY